ncbi:hypothetical protein SAMN04515618_101156 [Collimonas sp. OK307]|nr:hypothetical protein SAMN04515618_101156 [Collimonas sp. OK307]
MILHSADSLTTIAPDGSNQDSSKKNSSDHWRLQSRVDIQEAEIERNFVSLIERG